MNFLSEKNMRRRHNKSKILKFFRIGVSLKMAGDSISPSLTTPSHDFQVISQRQGSSGGLHSQTGTISETTKKRTCKEHCSLHHLECIEKSLPHQVCIAVTSISIYLATGLRILNGYEVKKNGQFLALIAKSNNCELETL